MSYGSMLLLTAFALTDAAGGDELVLRSRDGVAAVFTEREGRWWWSAYRDEEAGRTWAVEGPLFSLQTPDGVRADVSGAGLRLAGAAQAGADKLVFEAELESPAAHVRQQYAFCEDGRTLRIRSSVRAAGTPLVVQRTGLLELRLPGQALQRVGPGHVSSPVIGDRIFMGIEHPSALCQVEGESVWLAQHPYLSLGREWVSLPPAVFGCASGADEGQPGDPIRRAFLRYLDTVRVKPRDVHVHYNNWWTMPVPFTEADVLGNIAELRRGLYDATGRFFDSYAMDMGWSNPHSVWEVDRAGYPDGFGRIAGALAEVGSRPGLWVSPSSCYPPALDNQWLAEQGYEVIPGSKGDAYACLAIGGRYQRAFRGALLAHTRDGDFAHVKFDGLVQSCPAEDHGHRPGVESTQPIAEGLMDAFDALRAQDPDIALEPTCLGYYPSPWWLLHTPFVIGPFGDDCPRGRCPSPEWTECLTTARDIAILAGREAFWMPSSALECFDVIVQCPGDFYNHAVMAIARGHWFLSNYINPRFMDQAEWRFFAELIDWVRANRERLREPVVFGGDPAEREPYGYGYPAEDRSLYFARNPWMEPASIVLPPPTHSAAVELRSLYPRRQVLCRTDGAAPPPVALGPYETVVLESVPTKQPASVPTTVAVPVEWREDDPAGFERIVYAPDPPAFGPGWTCPDGDVDEVLRFTGAGRLEMPTAGELCVLVWGAPNGLPATCEAMLDGRPVAGRETGSRGAFYAAQAPPEEDWQWFLVRLPAGSHQLQYTVNVPDGDVRCGVYVRGSLTAPHRKAAFGTGPAFPVHHPRQRSWSHTLAALASPPSAGVGERRLTRSITGIDGVFLDALPWLEATAGWGSVQKNLSVMGRPMTMGGRVFHRGLGTHAHSRITYDLPGSFRRFAATIGCDQEVAANSVVFVVEADGREAYRSPVLRRDTEPLDINVPLAGARRLALIVEDGGDGIAADHGNWADARVLR